MIDCHYRRAGTDGEFQLFESTDGTRSNWDPEIQHGSPPLALMTKLIEELADSAVRIAGRAIDVGHSRRDPGEPGAGAGVGGTPR